MSDNYDDNYDDYYDEDGGGGEYDDYADEDQEQDSYQTSEFDLDNLAGKGGRGAKPPAANKRLLFIAGGAMALLLVVAAVFLVPRLLGGGGGGQAVADIPIATLIPTAAVVIPDTPTPQPSPTPTLAPPGATFISPAPGVRLVKGQSVTLEVAVEDGQGITSVNIEGAGLAPRSYSGEAAVSFTQNWAPENAGFYTLAVIIRNRLGQTNRVEGISVQVVDQEFIQNNAPTFATLDSNVAVLRGLSLRQAIEPVLMGSEGVKRYFRTEFTPEDANLDMLVLSSFDFVPRGFNLYEPAVEYTGNSIAGFYDPISKLFVLVSTDNEMDTYEQYVYVHELMHALQDQHFSLGELTTTTQTANSDSTMALRALAEGEAELLQNLYLSAGYFSADQVADIRNIAELRVRTINQAQSRSQAPEIWGSLFYFPYETGGAFVQAVYDRGGWAGVNEAWAARPTSTEQIIHPERYFAGDQPQAISVPDLLPTLGEGWQEIERTTLGEFYLRQYLGQRLDGGTVEAAATGWGGDQYAVYWQPTNNWVVLSLRLAWDSTADSDEFASAYAQYADAAYGSNVTEVGDGTRCRTAVETVCTYRQGDEWLIVRAPNIEIATTALAAMK